MTLSQKDLEKLKAEWSEIGQAQPPLRFAETLSAAIFFAMAPNFTDDQFVEFSAPIFLGRKFHPSEGLFHRNDLASLRISRNEYLSMLRYSAEGKAHSDFSSFSLKFWRLYRFVLKATHRIPKIGPKVCRILELPRLLLILARLPRRLEELENELVSVKLSQPAKQVTQ